MQRRWGLHSKNVPAYEKDITGTHGGVGSRHNIATHPTSGLCWKSSYDGQERRSCPLVLHRDSLFCKGGAFCKAFAKALQSALQSGKNYKMTVMISPRTPLKDGVVCPASQMVRLRGKGDDSDADEPVRYTGYKRTRPESPVRLAGHRRVRSTASWRPLRVVPGYRAVLALPVAAAPPSRDVCA